MRSFILILSVFSTLPLHAQSAGDLLFYKWNGTGLDKLYVAPGTNNLLSINGSGALGTSAASTYQPLDGDLTSIAALTTTTFGRGLLTASALTAAGLGLTNGAAIDTLGANGSAYYLARGNHTGTQAWSTLTGTPTTLSGYGITDAQPLDGDLTSIAALTTTTFGRGLLTASALTAAGLGLTNGAAIDTLGANGSAYYLARGNHTGTQAWSTLTGTPTTLSGYGITDAQPLDGDLTSIAALTTTTFGRGLLTASALTAAGLGLTNGAAIDTLGANGSAYYLARGNHTGTQAWSTLTGTPTTLSGYGITDAQPLDGDLTSIAALTTTTFGRGLLTASDLTAAGLGLTNGAAIDTLGANGSAYYLARGNHTGTQAWSTLTGTPTTLSGYGITNAQPLDGDLNGIAALTTNTFGRGLLTVADAAELRTTAGLVIGTNVQAYNAQTTLLGGSIELTTEVTGILPPANLGTGTDISTKYLRGDGTWQTVSGGSVTIGSATGTTFTDLAGLGTITGTGLHTINMALGGTITPGLLLNNTTTNNVGTVLSPSIYLRGSAFDDNSTFADHTMTFIIDSETTYTSVTAPTGTLRIQSQIDSLSPVSLLSMNALGSMTVHSTGGYTTINNPIRMQGGGEVASGKYLTVLGPGGYVAYMCESNGVMQFGVDSATAVHSAIKPGDGSGTDKAGAQLTLAAGQSTGTGIGGDLLLKTSNSGTTGTTANSYQTRQYHSARSKALTESTATTFANLAVAAGKYVGAHIVCTVTANDTTNYQVQTSRLLVDAINKAGTVTATITASSNTTATSSGTLTCTYTAVANGNGVDLKASAVSSLTQTTLTVKFSVLSLNSDGADTTITSGSLVTPQ